MEGELFGPIKRAHVTQTVVEDGHWSGSVHGLKIRFDIVPLGGARRVAWYVKGAGWDRKGVAGTVYEAMDVVSDCLAKRTAAREHMPQQQTLF